MIASPSTGKPQKRDGGQVLKKYCYTLSRQKYSHTQFICNNNITLTHNVCRFPFKTNTKPNSLLWHNVKSKENKQTNKQQNKNVCPASRWIQRLSTSRTDWGGSGTTVLLSYSESWDPPPSPPRLRGRGQLLLQEAVQRQAGWNLGWRPGDLFPFGLHQRSNLCQGRLRATMVKEPFHQAESSVPVFTHWFVGQFAKRIPFQILQTKKKKIASKRILKSPLNKLNNRLKYTRKIFCNKKHS